MVGFHMELGYQSGSLSVLSKEDQWNHLCSYTRYATENPVALKERLDMYKFPNSVLEVENCTQEQWIKTYLSSALHILEDEHGKQVMILASGGNDDRKAKEIVALAVCHFVMIACAECGVHVNLSII